MKKTARPKYRRILLKLSGEALGGEGGIGINPAAVQTMMNLNIPNLRRMTLSVVGGCFTGLALNRP